MLRISRDYLPSLALCLATVLGGCATTQMAESEQEIYQFSPIPVIEIAAQDLEPVPIRSPSELLEAANEAFAEANAAQEAGNHDEAYRQYIVMMELLLESDLDPTVFYNLRDEFGRILNTSTKLARTYERTQPSAWSQEVVELALRSELEFPNPLNDRVLSEIEAIRAVYPNNFQAGLDRSSKYLPYIQEELRKAGLPEDLAWLAMVESQFTPRINSRVGAGGIGRGFRCTFDRIYGPVVRRCLQLLSRPRRRGRPAVARQPSRSRASTLWRRTRAARLSGLVTLSPAGIGRRRVRLELDRAAPDERPCPFL